MSHEAPNAPARARSTARRPPGLAWSWTAAGLGVAYALPAAALVAFDDPLHGFAAAVGMVPAAILGLAPRRRARLATVVVGTLAGLAILAGAVLAETPLLAVAAIALLAVASARWAAASRVGQVAMTFVLPMVAIGFSFDDDVSGAAQAAVLLAAGSAVACAISMAWPERDPASPPEKSPPPRAASAPANTPTLGYGIRLGAAAATAAAIGFLLDLDHVGWACAAALLVMRPAAELQRLRSVGRVVAVAIGAALAVWLVSVDPPAGWYALAVVATLAGAAATHGSRWYVTAGFTTFLVFLLMLWSTPEAAGARFGERLGETALGVAIAYAFGLALPALTARTRRADGRA